MDIAFHTPLILCAFRTLADVLEMHFKHHYEF